MKELTSYSVIFVGTLFMAIALNVFFEPNNLVAGGVTGIAVIVKRLTEGFVTGGISLGFSNLVINLPLFLIAIKTFGKKFIGKTIIATILLSISLELTSSMPTFTGDFVIISVFGGILSGIGIALILRAGGTTGGTELTATIINHKLKHYTVSSILFIIDVIIIGLGYFLFGLSATMYAVISVYITSKVINRILEGVSFAKATFIISDKADDIYKVIFANINRGVTMLYGKGMFSKKEKNVLMCVVSQKEIFKLKELIKDIDKDAFVMVTDVREVLGQF